AHLLAVRKLPDHRADDLIQAFVTDKILKGELIALADRDKGRFRTFLLTAFNRFMIGEIRKEDAMKRSPGQGNLVELDDARDLPLDIGSPSEAFELAWVREVITEALNRVREASKPAYWGIFECRVVNPILNGIPAPPYDDIVNTFGFPSPVKASNALLTTKRMFIRFLREVIGEYVYDDDEIEDELRELKKFLAG
ncbi:MAG: hypothetical protein AAF492_24025, partial [Verrucomicrobiota bacterium]